MASLMKVLLARLTLQWRIYGGIQDQPSALPMGGTAIRTGLWDEEHDGDAYAA